MFWEKITIENASTIVLEKDLVRGIVRWSVKTANRTTSGEAETAAEAFREAVKAATGQQQQITEEALGEFIMFDLFDR